MFEILNSFFHFFKISFCIFVSIFIFFQFLFIALLITYEIYIFMYYLSCYSKHSYKEAREKVILNRSVILNLEKYYYVLGTNFSNLLYILNCIYNFFSLFIWDICYILIILFITLFFLPLPIISSFEYIKDNFIDIFSKELKPLYKKIINLLKVLTNMERRNVFSIINKIFFKNENLLTFIKDLFIKSCKLERPFRVLYCNFYKNFDYIIIRLQKLPHLLYLFLVTDYITYKTILLDQEYTELKIDEISLQDIDSWYFLLLILLIVYLVYLFLYFLRIFISIKSFLLSFTYNISLLLLGNLNFLRKILFFPEYFFSLKQKIIFTDEKIENKLTQKLISSIFSYKGKPILINELYNLNSSLNFDFFSYKSKISRKIEQSSFFTPTFKKFLSSLVGNSIYNKELKKYYKKNKKDLIQIFLYFSNIKSEKTLTYKNFSSLYYYYYCLGILHNTLSENFQSPFLSTNSIILFIIDFLSKKSIIFCDGYNSNFAYDRSVGFDLKTKKEIVLDRLERKNIPLSCFAHIPTSFFVQISPKSGISNKGLAIINSPGICDPLYQGELCTSIINLSNDVIVIEKNSKVAQGVLFNNINNTEEKEILESVKEIIKKPKIKNKYLNIIYNTFFKFDDKDVTCLNKNSNIFFGDIKYKNTVFKLVNEIYVNKRKTLGFGSSGK